MASSDRFEPRDTILMSTLGSDKAHLNVVFHVESDYSHLYMVPLNTMRYNSDTTVVLDDGDHPFVNRPTVVSYDAARKAETRSLHNLEKQISQTFNSAYVMERRTPVSVPLYMRILEGGVKSESTSNDMHTVFEQALLDVRKVQ